MCVYIYIYRCGRGKIALGEGGSGEGGSSECADCYQPDSEKKTGKKRSSHAGCSGVDQQ